jgi:hypothetical protein
MKKQISDIISDAVDRAKGDGPKDAKATKRGIKLKDVRIDYSDMKLTGKVELLDIPQIRSDIKKRKRREIRPNLIEWTSYDFALYFLGKYSDHLESTPSCRLSNITTNISIVHDSIVESMGFCDNVILKDYIDFLITNWMSVLLKRNRGMFKRSLMNSMDAIKNFVEVYDYNSRVEALLKDKLEELDIDNPVSDGIDTLDKITYEILQESFLLGYDNLLLDFGLIGSINWLIIVKKIPVETIYNKIVSSLLNFYDKPELNRVFELTQKYSPYPDWFVVKSCDIIFDRLKQKYSIDLYRKFNLTFVNDNNIWSF